MYPRARVDLEVIAGLPDLVSSSNFLAYVNGK